MSSQNTSTIKSKHKSPTWKPKIAIITCTHQRFSVFQHFLRHIDLCHYYFKPNLFVGGHEEGHRKELEKCRLKTTWVQAENKPLGKKFNTVLRAAKKCNPDYVFITGDDDIYNDRFWKQYQEAANQGFHFIGLLDAFLVDVETASAKYFPGYSRERKGETLGAGRMIHKHLLDIFDWELWENGINSGLDASMTKTLSHLNYMSLAIQGLSQNVIMVDLKSDVNIWSYNNWYGLTRNLEEVSNIFGQPILKDYGKNINTNYNIQQTCKPAQAIAPIK